MRTTLSGPKGTLNVEREIIPVNYLSDMDADWKYTDAHGHVHYCDYNGADHYPTLREVSDGTWWCTDCGDEHEDSHRECRQCGEEIVPGRTGPGTKYIAGLTTYTFNGEEITAEQAQELIARWGGGQ